MKLRLKTSLVAADGKGFMGIGLVWLLRGIDRLGSIREAAAEMNLSYAKAHAIIKRLEQKLEEEIVIRHRGGNLRGGAELSEFGQKFVAEYDLFQERVKAGAEREFQRFRRRLEKVRRSGETGGGSP